MSDRAVPQPVNARRGWKTRSREAGAGNEAHLGGFRGRSLVSEELGRHARRRWRVGAEARSELTLGASTASGEGWTRLSAGTRLSTARDCFSTSLEDHPERPPGALRVLRAWGPLRFPREPNAHSRRCEAIAFLQAAQSSRLKTTRQGGMPALQSWPDRSKDKNEGTRRPEGGPTGRKDEGAGDRTWMWGGVY